MFDKVFKSELDLIERHLRAVMQFDYFLRDLPQLSRFVESLNYSVFSEGKRFRPLLALLTAKALQKSPEQVLPLAAAVELIHTYSLIHDDLPCMDNDDFRRGLPTNHKMFGEAGALLAGDALLTMAFGILAQSPSPKAATAVALLSEAAGPRGMVGGQALDIEAQKPNEELLKEIHARKTGRLIQVSVEGAAALCEASSKQIQDLKTYGELLGLAFQLADDLQDFDEGDPEKVSYAATLGVPETIRFLETTSDRALFCLTEFGPSAEGLRQMIKLNRDRV
jgi:geranylgeranyl diphosphate synthase type II